MRIEIISIIFLLIVVTVGFVKQINIGFFSIGAAFLLGNIGGLSEKAIISGFGSSMFVTLTGVSFLFGMAQINGTLELMSKKIISLVGKNTFIIPILMFILSAFVSAIGPGHIATGVLMTTFAVYLSVEMKINPFITALLAKLGANAGSMSPISPAGVIAYNLSEPLGYTDFGYKLLLTNVLSALFFALIVFIVSKSYKVKADNPMKWSELDKFNSKQRITLLFMVIMVVISITFKLNVGLTSFVVAGILLLLNVADEKKAIKTIPWGTLVLIVGVGMLINVVKELGGIKYISDMLISMMTPKTATTIVAATSGVLSWFSSTTGVVMPTMFPISAEIVNSFAGNVSYYELVAAICSTSFAAALSPLSTGGAIIISTYAATTDLDTKEQNRLFKVLFLLSLGNVMFNVILATIGFFGI